MEGLIIHCVFVEKFALVSFLYFFVYISVNHIARNFNAYYFHLSILAYKISALINSCLENRVESSILWFDSMTRFCRRKIDPTPNPDSDYLVYMCSYHWIMLDIQIDKGRVDIFDPLSRNMEQFQSMQDMLQR
jgi:hypothetical protein